MKSLLPTFGKRGGSASIVGDSMKCSSLEWHHLSVELRLQRRKTFRIKQLRQHLVPASYRFFREWNTMQASADTQHPVSLRNLFDPVQPELFSDPILDRGVADGLDWLPVRFVAANLHSV